MIKYLIAAFVLIYAISGSTAIKGSEERMNKKSFDSERVFREVETNGARSHREETNTVRFIQLRSMPLQFIR